MTEDFEIIALNGLTGKCITAQDDWCQRLKEDPQEPGLLPEEIESIRQQHEGFFTQLEALVVQAIAKGYWDEVYDFINFHAPTSEES